MKLTTWLLLSISLIQVQANVKNNSFKYSDEVERIDVFQQFMVEGTILDSNGNPLPGANVLEKGTTNGTQSALMGNLLLM
ncbi:carboxypeptidase-like regulatory domain-containing protein [Arenibacter certesii]|nr:carboxypeptidase-like regulatory domain-containing protein [Arenibacter certesii]